MSGAMGDSTGGHPQGTEYTLQGESVFDLWLAHLPLTRTT